jgi:hypothetical protein
MADNSVMIRESGHDGFGDPSTDPSPHATSSNADGDRRGGGERRADYRARTLVSAKLLVGDAPTDCIVRNFSVRGAQVRVLGDVDLPPTVSLLLTSEGLLFDATIVWRKGDKLGLTFSGHHDLQRDAEPGHSAVRALWKDLALR